MNSSNEFDAYFETLLDGDGKAESNAEPSQREEARAVASMTHHVRAKAQESISTPLSQPTSGWEKARAGYPVSIARSALFSVGEWLKDDEWLRREPIPIPAAKGINMVYTGPRLTQEHARVFRALCILSEGVTSDLVVPHGDILELIGTKDKSQNTRQRLWRLIDDMIEARVALVTERVRYKGGLIHSIIQDRATGMVRIRIDHSLTGLFENELILSDLRVQEAMGRGQLYLWLKMFLASQWKNFPVAVEELRRLCGARQPMKKFRYALKQASQQLSEGEDALLLSWSIDEKDRFVYEKRATKVLMLRKERTDEPVQEKGVGGAVQRARDQRAKVAL